jgi:nitrate reductase (NAD(P)H)
MMNNCWYVVKPEIVEESDDGVPQILFRHPVEPGTGTGGWLKESTEIQIANAKQAAEGPQEQFTREEIEKHSKEDDCWIVIDGKVYDVTSVLEWHPGGKAAVLGHAGKLHQETSDDFSSIHDEYAYQKLNGSYETCHSLVGLIDDKRRMQSGENHG